MAELEKVIEGFRCCHVMVHDMGPDKTSCGICPYKDVQTEEQINIGGIECIAVLHDDAMELLKEQQKQIEQMNFIYGFVYGGQVKELRELIRCKDCKHRDPEDFKCDCGHGIQWQLPRQDDWFCADGERRE